LVRGRTFVEVRIYEKAMKIIHAGKVARVIEYGEQCFLDCTNDVTAGNGKSRITIPGMGEVRMRQAHVIWRYLQEKGIHTCFTGGPREGTKIPITRATALPLEVVVRFVADGSYAKSQRFPVGTPLETPVVEFFYKNDRLDDPLLFLKPGFFLPDTQIKVLDDWIHVLKAGTSQHAGYASQLDLSLVGGTNGDIRSRFREMKNMALQVGNLLKELFARGLHELVDFKLEFGFNEQGDLILIDRITGDEMRIYGWGISRNYFDKEIIRLFLKTNRGMTALSPEFSAEVFHRYNTVTDFLEGQVGST